MSLTRIVARAAWILPAFFFLLTLHQAKVAYDLDVTRTQGTPVTAEVLEVHKETRVDVTYDYVSVRAQLPDGTTIERQRLSLPHSVVPPLEGKKTLEARVLPGAAREIVITEKIGPTPVVATQWHIAAINAAISFGAFLLFGAGVFFWNRSLRDDGDPAERGVLEPDPDHPARQVAR